MRRRCSEGAGSIDSGTAKKRGDRAAQRLVILLLLDRIPQNANAAEVARMSGYSAMSASRNLDALEASGILGTEKSGRMRRLKPFADRRGFWELARPFLKSPVVRRIPLRQSVPPPGVLAAGQLALSLMSDLAEPAVPEYAAQAGIVEELQRKGAILDKDWSDSAALMLQVWSYPPVEGRVPGVAGLRHFAERFSRYRNAFVVIGGTACTEIFAAADIDFRATKDIDLILVAEAVDADFVREFRRFVSEGGYRTRRSETGRAVLYRFEQPSVPGFPVRIELFSRSLLRDWIVTSKGLRDKAV